MSLPVCIPRRSQQPRRYTFARGNRWKIEKVKTVARLGAKSKDKIYRGERASFRHSVRAEETRFRSEPCARRVFGIYTKEAMHRRKHDDLWMTQSDERINRSISIAASSPLVSTERETPE